MLRVSKAAGQEVRAGGVHPQAQSVPAASVPFRSNAPSQGLTPAAAPHHTPSPAPPLPHRLDVELEGLAVALDAQVDAVGGAEVQTQLGGARAAEAAALRGTKRGQRNPCNGSSAISDSMRRAWGVPGTKPRLLACGTVRQGPKPNP